MLFVVEIKQPLTGILSDGYTKNLGFHSKPMTSAHQSVLFIFVEAKAKLFAHICEGIVCLSSEING